MKESISAAVYSYIEISRKYDIGFYHHRDELSRQLDWRLFQICIYMSLPNEKLPSHSAEEFLREFRYILEYGYIEEDHIGNENSKNRRVKITGYSAADWSQTVTCFFSLSFLIYSHLMIGKKEQEKENFINMMLVYPCYYKIKNQFSRKEDSDFILSEFGLKEMEKQGDNLENVDGFRMKFDNYIGEYQYYKYVNPMEIQLFRNQSIEGRAMCIEKGREIDV